MNESHQNLSEEVFSRISFTLTERGFVDPMYIILLPDGNTVPIVLQEKTQLSMEMYSEAATETAKNLGASAMLFIAEQNMLSRKKGDVNLKDLMEGILKGSDHSNIEEYLTMSCMSAGGECESLLAKIHKDPMGTKYTNERNWIDGSVTNMLIPWKEEN